MQTRLTGVLTVSALATLAAAQEFRGLGFLEDPNEHPGASSTVYDISPDGRLAVGSADTISGGYWGTGGIFAVRWDTPSAQGPVALSDSLGGEVCGQSGAWAAADNGSAAGLMKLPGTNQQHGTLWTDDGQVAGMGFLGGPSAAAFAISADGHVLAGYALDSLGRYRAVRSEGGVATSLGTLFGDPDAEFSIAYATDATGTTIVGEVFPDGADSRPFWWRAADGMHEIPPIPNSLPAGATTSVTPDGRLAVGSSGGNDGWGHGFIYDIQTDTLTDIGHPPNADAIVADVNADATVIVGQLGGLPRRAGIWRDGAGWEVLADVLANEYGLGSELNGWLLLDARAISADGNTIVGNGIDPDGRTQAWIATLAAPCLADINGDGVVDSLDVLAFLNLWAAGDPRADFNEDGVVDTRDFLAFLNAWNAGC